jgi:hypothetical protein
LESVFLSLQDKRVLAGDDLMRTWSGKPKISILVMYSIYTDHTFRKMLILELIYP